MQSKLLVLTVVPAMLIAAAGVASAEDTAPARGNSPRQEMLAHFDANGDGKLDETERAAAREAGQESGRLQGAFMQGYDADGNGTLSDAEKAKAQADWKAFVAKHDTDGNGQLSRAESKAAREAWAKEHPEAAARLRAAVDKDGDGTISRKERRQAAKELRKKRQEAAEQK